MRHCPERVPAGTPTQMRHCETRLSRVEAISQIATTGIDFII